MPSPNTVVSYLFFTALLMISGAVAAGVPSRSIAIQNGRFVPAHLELRPGIKVKLIITNEDTLPAEFESFDLSREVIVPVKQSVTIFVGPLQSGQYEFFNDFNRGMRGLIVVKPDVDGGG